MKRLHLNLNLTSVILYIAVGVLLPVLLLTAAGIVAIAIADDAGGIVTGILVICFAMTAAGFGLVAALLAGKKARLARRQADFVANVSHEFRTPLSAIRLYTQTLQSGQFSDDPEKTAECLATILRETEWLDVMIDRVLDWRAASKDLLPLDLTTQTVEQAVDAAVERFRTLVPADEVDFSCSIESRLNVEHDHHALHAVVLNLLTNAYKYTGKEKRIALTVTDEEQTVVIEVSDNGIGMSPAETEHIFEPFYRAEHEGTRSGGVGLGLAIARHLVQQQKGVLEVTSETGEGSVFTIRLPGTGGDA